MALRSGPAPTMPKSALWPGTAKHWSCSGPPADFAAEDTAKFVATLLAIISRHTGQPSPVNPVKEMQKVPALLGHQGRWDLLRGHRTMAVLHRIRLGFHGAGVAGESKQAGLADRAALHDALRAVPGRKSPITDVEEASILLRNRE